MYSNKSTIPYTMTSYDKLQELIENADAIIIGAGAGLSSSAGLEYGGERFKKLFPEFIKQYHLTDMYSSAFYPFESLEQYWGYFSKHIYHNRYTSVVNSCYDDLLQLVQDKNYFVITTNADHLFIKSGFDKQRLFYTQGDYGLFQCSKGCHNKTYDNKEIIYKMVDKQKDLRIPTNLIPYCPVCGNPMDVNLRKDTTFIEDEGWNLAHNRYQDFLKQNKHTKVVYLELGIGYNTPSIIKYPFWLNTHQNKHANYVCINTFDCNCPKEIKHQSLCLEANIKEVFSYLTKHKEQ